MNVSPPFFNHLFVFIVFVETSLCQEISSRTRFQAQQRGALTCTESTNALTNSPLQNTHTYTHKHTYTHSL